MTVPIRLRLTAWYFGVMLLTLSLFGVGMFVAIRVAIGQVVDRDLHLRLAGVQEFMGRRIPQTPPTASSTKSGNALECGQEESCCK